MPGFTDQLGRTVELQNFPPRRIISLVPSQTELLFDLGLSYQVVGLTKFCIHPSAMFHTRAKVGGTKKLNLDRIRSLRPHLIIANKEENEKDQVEELAKEFPVWISDVSDLKSAHDMILQVGKIVGREKKAQEISREIVKRFTSLEKEVASNTTRKVAYFIWRAPYMIAGSGTFISEMLKVCQLQNAFPHRDRYPEINLEDLKEAKPELILLSSEPYPFSEKHIDEFKQQCPSAEIKIVDGELFSWYGSRLLKAPEYFKRISKN